MKPDEFLKCSRGSVTSDGLLACCGRKPIFDISLDFEDARHGKVLGFTFSCPLCGRSASGTYTLEAVRSWNSSLGGFDFEGNVKVCT